MSKIRHKKPDHCRAVYMYAELRIAHTLRSVQVLHLRLNIVLQTDQLN